MGFGATTFILSMFNLRAGGVMEPNVVLGMALGYGGLVQLIAGIEEFVCGNTFAATAFSSYGGFWFSFGSKSTSLQLQGRAVIDQSSSVHSSIRCCRRIRNRH
jgi:succinate-acetate transporter protein